MTSGIERGETAEWATKIGAALDETDIMAARLLG